MNLNIEKVKSARKRLIQMHYESGVGHIGGNLSCLEAILISFHEFINDDDKFILSKGHSSGALYIALWSIGLIKESDLRTFHKDNTLLPGHPPISGLPQVLFATGSLGHGLSLASGTALSMKLMNKNNRVICLTSDGEWQEGSTWEALIFACHHNLTNLTILVDHNKLQGFGNTTEVASMSPLWEKIKGFDIDIQEIDGHDLNAIRFAMNKPSNKCRIIFLDTIKGNGVSFMQNQMKWHYLPLNEEQYIQAINEIDLK
jgi:transketolase